MWNKIVRLFLYVAINVLFFLQVFLLCTIPTSPLLCIIMLVFRGLYKTHVYILIWIALSTALAIVLSIKVLWKAHKMKHS